MLGSCRQSLTTAGCRRHPTNSVTTLRVVPSEATTDLQQRLRRHVDVLAELIGERNTSHPSGLEAAREYIRRELRGMGHAVAEQPFAVHNRSAVTLEVVLVGTKPSLGTLVIGAHYDSAHGTPGADDNASAVAMLLEIARELAGKRVRRTTRIVFYDCEEPPHFNFGEMGSQFHAGQLKRSGENVLGMICLESVGFFSRERRVDPFLPKLVRWINCVFGQRYIAIVSDPRSIPFGWAFVWRFATSGFFWPWVAAAVPVRWVPDIELSDHRGYWEQGFRALMITDTAVLRNPNYHKASDRLATLDVDRMTRLCAQVTRAVRRLIGARQMIPSRGMAGRGLG